MESTETPTEAAPAAAPEAAPAAAPAGPLGTISDGGTPLLVVLPGCAVMLTSDVEPWMRFIHEMARNAEIARRAQALVEPFLPPVAPTPPAGGAC